MVDPKSKPADPRPRLAVVIPLVDDRGMLSHSIETLTRDQTAPGHAFEILCGAQPGHSHGMAGLAARLRPQDRIVESTGALAYELCRDAARAARAPWLFFTEAHCAWEPDLVERLLAVLERGDVDAADASSRNDSGHWMGDLEQALMERCVGERIANDDWRRVVARGFAVRRSLYEDVGGHDGEYGFFAEGLLARDLHFAGARIGHAADAVVIHRGIEGLTATYENIGLWVDGEARYRQRHGGGDVHEFFGVPAGWCRRGERSAWSRRARSAAVRAAIPATRRPSWMQRIRRTARTLRTRARLAGAALLQRSRVHDLGAQLGIHTARIRCSFGSRPRREAAYERLWTRCTHALWNAAVRRDLRRPHVRPVVDGQLELSGRDAAGFFAPQRDDARWVRRMTNLAVVRLPSAAAGANVTVNLALADRGRPVLVWCGHAVEAAWDGDAATFVVPCASDAPTLAFVDPARLGRRARVHPDPTRHGALLDIRIEHPDAAPLTVVVSPPVPVRPRLSTAPTLLRRPSGT